MRRYNDDDGNGGKILDLCLASIYPPIIYWFMVVTFFRRNKFLSKHTYVVRSKTGAIDLYRADNGETLTIVVASSHCLWFNVKIKSLTFNGCITSPFTFIQEALPI